MAGGESFEAALAVAADDLNRLVRRLRSLSPRAWQSRSESVRAVLDALVVVSAELEDRPLESPIVADHVLADAIAVVGADVLAAIASAAERGALSAVSRTLENALAGTR